MSYRRVFFKSTLIFFKGTLNFFFTPDQNGQNPAEFCKNNVLEGSGTLKKVFTVGRLGDIMSKAFPDGNAYRTFNVPAPLRGTGTLKDPNASPSGTLFYIISPT